MKKTLSHIIIFMMMIIAPVSFSTEEIPCFDVPGVEASSEKNNQKTAIAISRDTNNKPLPTVIHPLSEKYDFPSPSTFKTAFTLEISHGRSPPLSIHA